MSREGVFMEIKTKKETLISNSEISYYHRCNGSSTSEKTMTLTSFLNNIKKGTWRAAIFEIRETQDKKIRKELKAKHLPCVTISGTFPTQRENDAEDKIHSGFICVDFDDLPDVEGTKTLLNNDKFSYAVFKSASGTGLALIAKIDGEKHTLSFDGLKKYYEETYNLKIDKVCGDVARLRFASYDPDLFLNFQSDTYIPQKPSVVRKQQKATPMPLDVQEEQVLYMVNQIVEQDKIIFRKDDNYSEWRNVGFSLADALGEQGRKYFHRISEIDEAEYDKRTTNNQFDKCLKSNGNRKEKKCKIGYFIHLAKESDIRTHKGLKNQRRFTEGGKCVFEPLLEGRIYKENGDKRFIIYNSQLLMYENGYYKYFKDEIHLKKLGNQIEYVHDGRAQKSKEILEILGHQHHEMTEIKVNQNPHLINCKNGILDINTMELLEHTPDQIFTYQIPVKYDPNAKYDLWESFLEQVLVSEDKLETDYQLLEVLKRFFGYCFYTKLPFHECFILFGSGRNGKSVVTKILEKLFEGFYSGLHFEDIAKDRFATSELSGKLLNISSEFSAKFKMDEREFKRIVKGETMHAQRKHEKAFLLTPTVKHIISTNILPRSRDKSLGFFSTINILPFHKKFLPKDELDEIEDKELQEKCGLRIPNYEDKFIDELPGIFLWSIKGLKLLLAEKGFPYSEQISKTKKTFIVHNSSVESFFDEKTEDDCMENILLSTGYRAYMKFCGEYNIPPITLKWFAIEGRNLGYEILKMGDGKKTHIRGIMLKNEADDC